MKNKNRQSTGLETRKRNTSRQETKGLYLRSNEERKDNQLPEHKCPLCGKKFRGYGNNPRPLDFKGRVCNECNMTVIIPMRVMAFSPQQRA